MTTEATLQIDWLELIRNLLELIIPRSDDILSSPVKLGSLLTICMQFAEIEPLIRERATTLALQKHNVPGWTIVHRDGHCYVESADLLKLALGCPVARLEGFLSALVKQLGNISEAKYQALCESAGLVPQPEAIQQTGATVFLRRNQTNNQERK
jgi:hypothetical protein